MSSVIISDTSCLIALDRINCLEILQQTFGNIITTPDVQKEFGTTLPDWILIKEPFNISRKDQLAQLVDKGEASAIALSLEISDSILIIDEKKGRNLARELGVNIIGTLKVLLIAKKKNVIPSIKSVIQKLEQSNFRFSKAVINKLLEEAEELN